MAIDRSRPRPPVAALLRLHITYLWRHRRRLSIRRPLRFTELVQRRKLIDHDPRFPQLIDKLLAKQAVADALGDDWITPTAWSGDTLPDAPPCPAPFVVKSRHGCRQLRVVRSEGEDWAKIRRVAASWTRRPYGRWLDEWGYRDVPRGLLIEPFIGAGPKVPLDYKLFVFHGRVEAIQVHRDRETSHHWLLYDRWWRRLSTPDGGVDAPPPDTLDQMIEGAEILGSAFDFVRVDFYDAGNIPRFGEMTFYPGSGLEPFDPPHLDSLLGQHWLAGAG